MHNIPSPLDHLAAFVMVFGLGVLAACLWQASLRLRKRSACTDSMAPTAPVPAHCPAL